MRKKWKKMMECGDERTKIATEIRSREKREEIRYFRDTFRQRIHTAQHTFNVMFFRIVSSKTACSLRLISNDKSSVISDSLVFLYNDDIVVAPFVSNSLCKQGQEVGN